MYLRIIGIDIIIYYHVIAYLNIWIIESMMWMINYTAFLIVIVIIFDSHKCCIYLVLTKKLLIIYLTKWKFIQKDFWGFFVYN